MVGTETATRSADLKVHAGNKSGKSKAVILCVDDERVIRQSLKAQLAKHFNNEYSIETASNGEEALEVLEELAEDNIEVAVLISDQTMPGMRGDELLAEAHRTHPSTSKILLTGQANFDGVIAAINTAQLYRYIPKPWDPTDLNMTVTEAVRSYFQKKKLEEQNIVLQELVDQLQETNESLEDMVAERTRELMQQKEETEAKNEQITTSINYARRIQSAILPSPDKVKKAFPQSFILDIPRDIVSGDFYWLGQNGRHTVFVAADCTGHGVPGAMMSFMGGAFLNQVVSEGTLEAGAILQQLDAYVRIAFQQESEEGAHGSNGLDCVLIVIDHEQKKVQFAGAMNPLYFVKDDCFDYLRGTKSSIGDKPRDGGGKLFQTHELSFQDSPLKLYMGSDGYQDQFGGDRGKKFTGKRLRQLLSEIHNLPMEEQHQELRDTFEMWKGDTRQTDDVLFIGLVLE